MGYGNQFLVFFKMLISEGVSRTFSRILFDSMSFFGLKVRDTCIISIFPNLFSSACAFLYGIEVLHYVL